MGAGRVLKQAKEAGETASRVLRDDLHRFADDIGEGFGNFGRKTRGGDVFDERPDMPNAPDRPRNPPIDRDRNPDWLNERLDDPNLEYWRRRMAEGDQFNYQNHHRYPQNEVTLDNGKRLDSYRPGEEIVSMVEASSTVCRSSRFPCRMEMSPRRTSITRTASNRPS